MKDVVIIGAGPAGLTAAYELSKNSGFHPVVIEKDEILGGIARTVVYKGNRIDIGGHRFFSKSDKVVQWWLNILGAQNSLVNHAIDNNVGQVSSKDVDLNNGMLVRKRKSRIYYQRTFFDYPIILSRDTIYKLGIFNVIAIGFSYMYAQIFPIKPENSLEDFYVNRFGRKLYQRFFCSYTEKVWGVPASEISAEWGAQRVKGLSITKAILHAIKKKPSDIGQKDTETSLIERFYYPKYGPGQLWEEVASKVKAQGGEIQNNWNVMKFISKNNRIIAVTARNNNGELKTISGDYFLSTMPITDLINGLDDVPINVKEVANGLMYRDFITVGLVLKKLSGSHGQIDDNWIYIQEPDVLVGRLQIFNNWSPFMVKESGTLWVGLEYFCKMNDNLWRLSDEEMKRLAIAELVKIGLADQDDFLDGVVIRMEKTYPAYFGTYDRFDLVKNYLNKFENLFCIGRNGMHKYNNQDHSMLTAMAAVDNILTNRIDKTNIWSVNTEQEYHEGGK